jgi:outer membrane protein, heavy metal efflux system
MRVVACVVIVTVIAVAAPAAVRAQRPLSLSDAQAEARARAPEAAELQARIAGAEAIAAQARRVLREDPAVSTSVFRGSLVGQADESSWNVSATQRVDISGSWKPRGASAAADLSRARFEGEDGLRALDERVAQVVADVALAQRGVTRLARTVDLQQVAADAARRQFEVGTAPQIDADAATLDLAGAQVTLEQARGELEGSRWRLARLLGRETVGDLVVDDPPERPDAALAPDFVALVERDPRVRAASAEMDAARFEQQTLERLLIPALTFGVEYGKRRTEIPFGAFTGTPLANALRANWMDTELLFSVSVPVPLFDRQREPRARVTGRIHLAEARLRAARADVRTELESAWALLQAASRGYQRVAATPEILDRNAQFIEQAVRAGEFDATTRTQALRRLEEAGRRVDTAIRDLRFARAAWVRRAIDTTP